MTVSGEWFLPVLISTCGPFVIFSLPCPTAERTDGMALVGAWYPAGSAHCSNFIHYCGAAMSSFIPNGKHLFYLWTYTTDLLHSKKRPLLNSARFIEDLQWIFSQIAIKHMHNFQSFMDMNCFTVFIYKILKIEKVYPQQSCFKYVLGCLPLLPILRKCVHWLVSVIIASISRLKQRWVTDCLSLKLAPMVMWTDPVARKARQMLFFN